MSGDPIRPKWVVGTAWRAACPPHCPRPGCEVGPCSCPCGAQFPGEHPPPSSSLVSPAPGTHAVVAAPACLSVRRLCHLHGAILLQVPHAAQAAVVIHSVADAAGEEALGCPHLADLTHLVIQYLGRDGQVLSRGVWAGAWLLDLGGALQVGVDAEGQRGREDGNEWGWHREEVIVRVMPGQVKGGWVCLWG